MEILLIRHGQSEADILNVHEGRADFSLTELGKKQAMAMAERVAQNFPPNLIWASPLKRAKETANILQKHVECPIQFDENLMEFNNGILAGMSREEGKKHPIPKSIHERIENGESTIEFRMRVEIAFAGILAGSNVERVAIVAHGVVINHLLRSFYKMPLAPLN